MKQELTKLASLRAISMLAVFTFLFLSTEYFYVNQIAQNASSARTVNVQNYALGVSAVGFCLYPLLFRFFRDRLHSAVFFTLTMLAIVCFVILGSPVPPGLLTAVGMLLFLVLGILGSAVHYHFLCEISDKKYFARMVGISYGFAILLQFLNNSLISSALAEQLLLCAALLFIVFFLFRFQHREASRSSQMPDTANSSPQVSDVTNPCPHMPDAAPCVSSGSTDSQHKLPAPSASGALPQLVLLIFLVIFMTCIFSTLDNTVTLGHADGTMDIGQWPRLFLALSGLLAGVLFDLNNGRYRGLIMYAVTILSTICVLIIESGGSFLPGLLIFYVSAGFFVVFFTNGFIQLSYRMQDGRLWAGMGRAANNLGAVIIGVASVSLLNGENHILTAVLALVLFVLISVALLWYYSCTQIVKAPEALESREMSAGQSRLERFVKYFDLTEREQEVLQLLLLSDDGMQEIADSLFVSRAMLYRHIAALNEKTGTRSRIGLIQFYYNWEEDKKYLSIGGNLPCKTERSSV